MRADGVAYDRDIHSLKTILILFSSVKCTTSSVELSRIKIIDFYFVVVVEKGINYRSTLLSVSKNAIFI